MEFTLVHVAPSSGDTYNPLASEVPGALPTLANTFDGLSALICSRTIPVYTEGRPPPSLTNDGLTPAAFVVL